MAVKYGMIHGRFQPFHNGHLEYLRHALAQCEVLIIGITNPDPEFIVEERANPQRHLAQSNPYTFFQRLVMIQETLKDEGIPPERYHIVPFPIHHPHRWRYYMPKDVVHYIRVFSPWEQEKVERMREQGLQVVVLDPGSEKEVDATRVRRALQEGDEWRALVPLGVARTMERILQGTL